jgi:hypothetical protein
VLAQWAAPEWAPSPLSLRVAPFGALVPAARFVQQHELGVTHVLPAAAPGAPPALLHASRAALALSPLLGAPRHALELPCDAHADFMPAHVAHGASPGGAPLADLKAAMAKDMALRSAQEMSEGQDVAGLLSIEGARGRAGGRAKRMTPRSERSERIRGGSAAGVSRAGIFRRRECPARARRGQVRGRALT